MWPAPSICASIWYASDRRAPWKKNTARKARSGTCRYGELVRRPEDPVKEGYVFDGWYWDVEREHRPWDFAQDTVEDSMYLYARWQPVP